MGRCLQPPGDPRGLFYAAPTNSGEFQPRNKLGEKMLYNQPGYPLGIGA